MLTSSKISSPPVRADRAGARRAGTIVTAAALALSLLAGCSVSPTGRSQIAFMSEQQLSTLGAQSFEELKQKMPIERDRQTNRYVRCVADAITAEVGGRSDWEVVVFRDDSANAFALPGGKIGVHTGLLDVAKNQDQLAAVIGHEVGHVLADHSNERMSQGTLTQGVLVLADAALGAKGVGARTDIVQALGIGAQYGVLLPYSRSHESEADIIGLDLMARAGFDPRESAQLWRNMKTEAGGAPPELLSSHPAPDTRINDLQARMGPALEDFQRARSAGKRPRC